jgi:hypothetical protein
MLPKVTVLISLAASLWVGIVPVSYASAKHYQGVRASAGVTLHRAAFGYQVQGVQPQFKTLHWIDNPEEPGG